MSNTRISGSPDVVSGRSCGGDTVACTKTGVSAITTTASGLQSSSATSVSHKENTRFYQK